jgi:hypothetical protein
VSAQYGPSGKLKKPKPPRQQAYTRNMAKKTWAYSQRYKNSKPRPPNSTRWPATSSDSASEWSKGARFASKSAYRKNASASGGSVSHSGDAALAAASASKAYPPK